MAGSCIHCTSITSPGLPLWSDGSSSASPEEVTQPSLLHCSQNHRAASAKAILWCYNLKTAPRGNDHGAAGFQIPLTKALNKAVSSIPFFL